MTKEQEIIALNAKCYNCIAKGMNYTDLPNGEQYSLCSDCWVQKRKEELYDN